MNICDIRNPDISETRFINNQNFRVRVKEHESSRFGKKKVRLIGVWYPNESCSIVSDRRYSSAEGILRDETYLPPLHQHISDLLNKAVAKHSNQEDKEEEMKKKTEAAMNAVEETWDKECNPT